MSQHVIALLKSMLHQVSYEETGENPVTLLLESLSSNKVKRIAHPIREALLVHLPLNYCCYMERFNALSNL